MPENATRADGAPFWRARHDWITYKVPVPLADRILPHEYLRPGYVPDVSRLSWGFLHDRRDGRKLGDFSKYGGGNFFVNSHAYETFEGMFKRHGRVYPVPCNGEKYFLVLVDTLHDAIDLVRSRFKRTLEGNISKVSKVVLKRSFTTEDDVFRIDHGFALSLELIVSSRFRTLYELHNLTGLFFEPTDGATTTPAS